MVFLTFAAIVGFVAVTLTALFALTNWIYKDQ